MAGGRQSIHSRAREKRADGCTNAGGGYASQAVGAGPPARRVQMEAVSTRVGGGQRER